MTRKEELMKVFEDMKDIINVYQQEVEKIRNNSDYSESFKESKIADLRESWGRPRVKEYHDKAIQIIADAQTALETKWTAGTAGKLTDAGYQTGLANVLQMLQMNAIPAVGFADLVEVYKDDMNALNAFRAVVDLYEDHRKKEYLSLIPHDPREATHQLLNQARNEIDTMISMEQLNSHNFAMGFGLRKRFIYDTLNDDLSA